MKNDDTFQIANLFHNGSAGAEENCVRITDNDDVNITGNLKISTAGNGIDFSATSDASGMSSELLDDYEEGSWTPKIAYYSGGGWPDATMTNNGTVAFARYTKIGRYVFICLQWNGFEVANSSYAVMTGLPFAGDGVGTVQVSYQNCFTNSQLQSGLISNNGAQFEFYRAGNNWNAFRNNVAGLYIYLSATYQTDT